MNIEFLQIEPTTRCNFSCGFCCGRSLKQLDMSLHSFKEHMKRLKNLKHVQLQGEGEPFLSPYIFDFINIINDVHPKAKVSITTNGSLLNQRVVNKLIEECSVYSILISVESIRSDRFRAIRGGNLDRVVRGIQRLVAKKKSSGMHYPYIGLAVTVIKDTIGEIDDIAKFFKENGLDGEFTLQFLQTKDSYVNSYSQYMKGQLVNERDQSIVNVKHNEIINEINSSCVGFFDELYNHNNGCCPWLEKGAYISSSGDITPCCYIKNGNNASLDEIKADFKDSFKKGIVPSLCKGCPEFG